MDGSREGILTTYNIVVSASNGMPFNYSLTSECDLITRFKAAREAKRAYFEWDKGCMVMYNVLGVYLY